MMNGEDTKRENGIGSTTISSNQDSRNSNMSLHIFRQLVDCSLFCPSERSLSPSDTEFSSPEVAVCYDVQLSGEEEDEAEDNEQEISENGQEVPYLNTPLGLVLFFHA